MESYVLETHVLLHTCLHGKCGHITNIVHQILAHLSTRVILTVVTVYVCVALVIHMGLSTQICKDVM